MRSIIKIAMHDTENTWVNAFFVEHRKKGSAIEEFKVLSRLTKTSLRAQVSHQKKKQLNESIDYSINRGNGSIVSKLHGIS